MLKAAQIAAGVSLVLSLGALAAPSDTDAEVCLVRQFADKAVEAKPEGSWWYMRQGQRVETRSSDGELGEIWTRSSESAPGYLRLDHVERVAIEYASGDFGMAGIDVTRLWYWASPLPELIETRSHGRQVWLRPVDCKPRAQSDVKMSSPELLDTYRLVDFIDLGDMEGDPQLERVLQRQR